MHNSRMVGWFSEMRWTVALLPLTAAACSGAGHDGTAQDEQIGTVEKAIRNGAIVTPFGPNSEPDYTRAIVRIDGCTGTLIDPYWAMGATHCGPGVGSTITSVRPSGNVSATADAAFVQPGDADITILHLSSPIDMPLAPLMTGTTADIVGNAVDCYGYGAMAAGGSCTTSADCPSGQWCAGGSCLTSSADLRMGTMDTSTYSNPLFFLTSTNAAGQMILPGDSGGPCFLNGAIAGVNSFWYFDLSGGGHASVPAASAWLKSTLEDTGFVWSSNLTGSFDASSFYSYNSSGGTNHITWLSTGQYRVDFPGLGNIVGGNVQVTAYGSGSERCKVDGWGSAGSTLQAWISCYTAGGALTDSLFTANYVRRAGTPGQEGAYVWAYDPWTESYTPATPYQWDSTGGAINITHTPGTGSYAVTFAGQDLNGGTVEVTAYGWGNSYCKVAGWGGNTAWVVCFDGSTGAPVESQFTLIFSNKSPNNSPSYTYAWADQPSSEVSYNPSTWYERGVLQTDCGSEQTMPNATITRSSAGRYTVQFPGMASISPYPSNVKVTGYSSGSDTCKVVGWWSSGSDAFAEVACFSPSGDPVDAYYTITYSSFAYTPC
jgi:hypothetical protein